MNAEAWVGLVAVVVTLILAGVGQAVSYGMLRGSFRATIDALAARVSALEGEMSALAELKVTVAEVKTTMTFMLEQFKELNSAIRWMREPGGHEPPAPPPAAPRRRP